MKERPIIFSAEMVQAILDGRKTQTRRVMKVPPREINGVGIVYESDKCPYGQPGNRLWVRETWAYWGSIETPEAIIYRTDGDKAGVRWRPSIYMPRKYSRITLEVTGVRVERVQDISHRDALAEGVSYDVSQDDGAPVPRFQKLWDSINAKRGYSWDKNPWVWVVEFKEANA